MSSKALRGIFIGVGFACMGAGLGILIVGHIPESNVIYHGAEKYTRAFFGVAVGLLIIMAGLRIKKAENDKVVVCPKCGTSYHHQDVSEMECPTCHVMLEDLKGFYDRHPEFK